MSATASSLLFFSLSLIFIIAGNTTEKAATEGVHLEDVSDDDNDEYSEGDESDNIELETDEAINESEIDTEATKMSATLKKTPKKSAFQTPTKADDLASSMKKMSLSLLRQAPPCFSMDFKLPFIISVYNEGLEMMARVEVFVPTLPEDYFVRTLSMKGSNLKYVFKYPTSSSRRPGLLNPMPQFKALITTPTKPRPSKTFARRSTLISACPTLSMATIRSSLIFLSLVKRVLSHGR